MRNNKFLAIVLILLLGLLLAACGAAQPAAPVATEAPATEAAMATEAAADASACTETVTIEFWNITTAEPDQALLTQAVDAFEKDNPCAKVNVTVLENENFKAKMTTVMQSG